jgi:hypothetical protein
MGGGFKYRGPSGSSGSSGPNFKSKSVQPLGNPNLGRVPQSMQRFASPVPVKPVPVQAAPPKKFTTMSARNSMKLISEIRSKMTPEQIKKKYNIN